MGRQGKARLAEVGEKVWGGWSMSLREIQKISESGRDVVRV